MHDVAVVEFQKRKAAIHTGDVAVITGSVWQVESEVSLNSSHLVEDLAKLVSGSAFSKLLIAAVPRAEHRFKDWLDFIEHAAADISGNFFLALIPSYSENESAAEYRAQTASIRFYSRIGNVLEEHPARLRCPPVKFTS